MKNNLLLLFLLLASNALLAQTKTFFIHPEKANCMGVGPGTCLQYRNSEKASWKLLYEDIAGFKFTPGYYYKLQVIETRIAKPAADQSSISRKLVKVLSKKQAVLPVKKILNKKWQPTSVSINGILTEIQQADWWFELGEKTVTAKFCNRFRGNALVQTTGVVKIGPLMGTKMACPDMQLEFAVTQALEKGKRWWLNGKTLMVFGQKDELILEASEMVEETIIIPQPPQQDYEAILTQSSFKIHEINEASGKLPASKSGAFIRFDPSKKIITGNGGCNNFFGELKLHFTSQTSGVISISKMGSTMMECPENRNIESKILHVLPKIDGFMFDKGKLLLTTQGNTAMILVGD